MHGREVFINRGTTSEMGINGWISHGIAGLSWMDLTHWINVVECEPKSVHEGRMTRSRIMQGEGFGS